MEVLITEVLGLLLMNTVDAVPTLKCQISRRTMQKNLHNPKNHNGVITHLEPDILECEVKRAFGSITVNKASGGDGIPVELFQILKML